MARRMALAEGWATRVTGTPLPTSYRDLVGLMARAAQHFLRPDLHVAESIR